MKIKVISQFFLALFIISLVATCSILVYLKLKMDASPKIISSGTNQLIQKKFSWQERLLATYKVDKKFYFNHDYFQFLVLQNVSYQQPELLAMGIKFYYDDLLNSRSVKVVIENNPLIRWNYSII